MKKAFTTEWVDWLNTNINNGQDKNGLFKILLDEGFAYKNIVKQMNYQPTLPVEQLVNPFNRAKTNQEASNINASSSSIKAHFPPLFIPNSMRFNNPHLELYTLENF